MRFYGNLATLPFRFRKHKSSNLNNVSLVKWVDYLSAKFNKKGLCVLELGLRNVTGANFRSKFSNADDVGFELSRVEMDSIVGGTRYPSQSKSGEMLMLFLVNRVTGSL
jgi:hypothetical protein